MSSAASQHRLRLAGVDGPEAHAAWARRRRARHGVIAETRRSAQNPELNPVDPRWVLAVRTHSQLQGSALTPDKRERVMRTANSLGIRPFDANVIIAIVQDAARRGEQLGTTAPTLALVHKPNRRRSRTWTWLRWLAVFATALTANAFAIWWLLST